MCVLVPCARAHARRRCGAAAAWPGSIRAPSCPNSSRGGGGGMVTNPEAHAAGLDANGRPRPRGAGELPLHPLSSPCTCLSPSLPDSEEDIIVVHKRGGQKRKLRVDPAYVFVQI
jgi:hypothetical protein